MTVRSLVVGSTGLIGSAILQSLHAATPVRLDWRTDSSVVEGLRSALARLPRGPEGGDGSLRIFWAAGRSVISSDDRAIASELARFRAALDVIVERANDRLTFVHISSAGALHAGTIGSPITESTPAEPASVYGEMKLEQERLVAAACAATGMRGLVLRAPTVYGPQQDPSKPQGLVSALVRSARMGPPVAIYVPRDTRRHYLWSADLGRISAEAIARTTIESGMSEIRHVLTERSRTIDEVVAIVSRVARRRPVVSFRGANHAPGHGVDLTLRSEFSPTWTTSGAVGLAEGVRRLLDHRGADWDRESIRPSASSTATASGPTSMPRRSRVEASRMGAPRGSSDAAT